MEGSQPENGVAGDFMLNIISGDTSHVKPIGPTLNAAAQQPVTSLIGHKHVMKHVAFVTFRLRRCFNHHWQAITESVLYKFHFYNRPFLKTEQNDDAPNCLELT